MIVDAIKGDQDGQEDWARWKDEVLFKDMIAQEGLENVHVPGPNGRSSRPSDELLKRALEKLDQDKGEVPAKGLNRPADIETAWQKRVREQSSDFCPECKIPLLPDPNRKSSTLPACDQVLDRRMVVRGRAAVVGEGRLEVDHPAWEWAGNGAGEASLPKGLTEATKSESQLSSSAISSLITTEIEEKASRLAEPQKYVEQDRGVELTQVRQLVDCPTAEHIFFLAQSLQSPQRAQASAYPSSFRYSAALRTLHSARSSKQTLARAPQQAQHASSQAATSSSIHSGHVRVVDDRLAPHALEAYFDAKLGIAKTAYLLTALHEFPRELAKELKHEKYIGGASKRAKWKAKELRKALAKKDGKKLGTQKTMPGLIEKPLVLRVKRKAASTRRLRSMQPPRLKTAK